MSGVFISYRRKDAEDSARALYESLLREFDEDRLFLDVTGVDPGSDYRDVVEHKLNESGVFLVIIGPIWLNIKADDDPQGQRRLDDPSDYVRQEVATALNRGSSLLVIPVLVRGATLPTVTQLPHDLKDLAYREALTLSHLDWDGNVQRLVTAIRPRVLDKDGSQPADGGASVLGPAASSANAVRVAAPAAVTPVQAASGPGNKKLLLIGIAVLLVAAIIGYRARSSSSQECGISLSRDWTWKFEPPSVTFAIDGKIAGKAVLDNEFHPRVPFACTNGEHHFLFQIEDKHGGPSECSGNFLVSEPADYRPDIHVTNGAADKCGLHQIAQVQR